MAQPTSYNYTKLINSTQLTAEIQASPISVALDHIETSGTLDIIYFKDVLSDGDKTTLDSIVAAHVPGPAIIAQPTNIEGAPIVEMNLRRAPTGFSNFTICTHDFSDRTTWYQKSVAVASETLTDSGDGLTFNSANPHWINMKSPKLTIDYKKVLERDGSLTAASLRYVSITSNGTALAEGADYTVNYAAGTVLFAVSQSGNTVVASYYHNNGVTHCSEFLFTPPPNMQYGVEHLECQFSKNAIFSDTIQVEVWAGGVSYADSVYTVNLAAYGGFAGAYYDAGYGQSRTFYRNVRDLINWTNNQYPVIPACCDLENDVLVFPFLYVVHPSITAKQGVVVRVINQNDIELSAEIATLTLYMQKGPA